MQPRTTALAPAAVFFITATAWAQVDYFEEAGLTAGDPGPSDQLGYSVSVSGDTALIGAPFDDDVPNDSGSAYVFVRSGTTWTEHQKLTASDALGGDQFGRSVSISGDVAVIGAPFDVVAGVNSGSAYVFVRSGTSWTEQQKLTASNAEPGSQFGASVSISGNTVAVGAYLTNGRTGSVYVFEQSGTTWAEQQWLVASDGGQGDVFGWSVSISGNTVVAGAFGDDAPYNLSGSAYVFVRNGTIWTEQQKLAASDPAPGDLFGTSVSISGDTAVVGAYSDDVFGFNSGSAYVFVRSGTTWTQEQKIAASDGTPYDFFGSSVSIDGDTFVAGAYRDDPAGGDSGSAYVFVRNAGVWILRQKLTATLGASSDWFGWSTSISGDTILVGAPLRNSPQADAGAAYVFLGLPSPAAFCDGSDGALAFCPCGNIASAMAGCDNAQHTGGVQIQLTSYAPMLSTAELTGTGYWPGNSPTVIAIRGSSLEASPVAFGDGIRCIAAPIVRFGATAASGGSSIHSVDHDAGGGTFYYQLWYRNVPASFCDPAAAWNTSNGISVTWP